MTSFVTFSPSSLPSFQESFYSLSSSSKDIPSYSSSSHSTNTLLNKNNDSPMNSTATLTPSTSPYSGVGSAQKRKLFEMEPTMIYTHDPSSEYYESHKRTMFSSAPTTRLPMMTGSRQRQESGSSVSSTSSWSSTSSYSSISSSSSSSSSCPGLAYPSSTSASAAARFRASPRPTKVAVSRRTATVRSLTPSSSTVKPTLYDICDAIELHAGLQHALKGRSVEETTTVAATQEGDYELKFVFVAPNWLQDHVAKAKKAVSMRQK